MNFKLKFIFWNKKENKYSKDDKIYDFKLNDELVKQFDGLEIDDNRTYQLLKNSEAFIEWVEDIYKDMDIKKVGISKINDINYLKFWFYKPSSEALFEFFLEYFDLFFEDDWDDKENMDNEIQLCLIEERKKMLIQI